MAQGRLRVTVVEAAKLTDKDKTDFNDPYVELYIDEKKKHKTRTLQDAERPVWNETFDLYVSECLVLAIRTGDVCTIFSDLWPSHEYLYINLFDEDEGKKDDRIGSTKVSLDKVIEKGQVDEWIKLPGFLGFGSNGDLRIRMSFTKGTAD